MTEQGCLPCTRLPAYCEGRDRSLDSQSPEGQGLDGAKGLAGTSREKQTGFFHRPRAMTCRRPSASLTCSARSHGQSEAEPGLTSVSSICAESTQLAALTLWKARTCSCNTCNSANHGLRIHAGNHRPKKAQNHKFTLTSVLDLACAAARRRPYRRTTVSNTLK